MSLHEKNDRLEPPNIPWALKTYIFIAFYGTVNNLVFRWPKLYFSWFWGLMVYIYIFPTCFLDTETDAAKKPDLKKNDSATIFPHTIHGIGEFFYPFIP